ncbi:adenylate/guanylate cyclase domain-containing protein [Actinomadura craniellae]|uniref:adenylate/guanylate cyclase domain-containing protein n=1 Tax=Actinomadura craniellae TaxID=2231787 RepID=UPI001F3F5806|nr:adenylate/guanylate cyclase domain-containing protein [Actinomadura craniellae]
MSTSDQDVVEILLGGPPRHTRAEVEQLSGISQEFGLRIWRALGFPAPGEDEIAFTDHDVEALREIRELLGSDLIDEEMVLTLSRAVGTTMGRLANWLGGVWLQRMAEAVPDGEPVDETLVAAALTATAELRPSFERLLMHGWRRQLAAAGLRTMSTAAAATADPGAGTALLTVGFADVVSFTRLSRQMDGDELAGFVERFEAVAAEIIAELGGRLVKTLGDEVLFTADDPARAAEIGLLIAERCDADAAFPRVRVGLAYGEVILRLGDVFGTPVNLAARLTAIAYSGSVLVDSALALTLANTAPYATSGLRPRHLQGLGKVRPYTLRRG